MKNLKTTVLLFTTAIVWGFAFVAQRVGADYLGAYSFNGIRFMLGAVSLIPVIALFEKRDKDREVYAPKMKKTVLVAIAAGFILFAASTLQQYGIEITGSAGKAGFITGLYTVLVPIFGVFMKKKTNVNIWIGAVLAVVGIYLLSVNEDFTVGFGDVVLLIGAFFWAFHILIIDRFSAEIYSLRFAAIQFFFCSLFGLCGAAIFETVELSAVRAALVPILYGGIMSVGVAYTCQILAQKDADPTYASIVFSTESVFSAIGAAIILGEVMSMRGYLGCALIFAGIVISQLKSSRAFVNGIRHFITITRHRHKVIALCFKAGIPLRGLLHDLSKYSPTEFISGARFYIGTRSPNEAEREKYGYSRAWLHHKGRNRHHFEYWTDYNPVKKRVEPVKMPTVFVKEMFCDRIAASKVYQGKNYTDKHPVEYFMRGKANRFIHSETSDLIESWLIMLSEKGEKETFKYIRRVKNEK